MYYDLLTIREKVKEIFSPLFFASSVRFPSSFPSHQTSTERTHYKKKRLSLQCLVIQSCRHPLYLLHLKEVYCALHQKLSER